MASTARQILTIVALLSVAPAGVGAQEENELDRFMARVLEQQGRNVARGLQYVLDERAEVRLAGPDRELLVQGDYTWYARDGVFVRSPLRVDGVTIGAEERRAYEAEWLEREGQRRTRRAQAGEEDAAESVAADDALMMNWLFAGLAEETAQGGFRPGRRRGGAAFRCRRLRFRGCSVRIRKLLSGGARGRGWPGRFAHRILP